MSELQINIESYDEFNANLNKLRDMANFIPDTSTKDGYQKSKRVALDIQKVVTKLEKVRKEEKAYFLEGGRQVDSQAKEIKAALEEIKAPHLEAYKAIDNAEKLAKERRMKNAQEKIDVITALIDKAEFATSEQVSEMIEIADGFDPDDGLYELTGDGVMAKQRVMKKLVEYYEAKKQQEKDAAELEVLRKKQAEQEQKEHDERIAREASERAEREKIEAIEREEKAKQALIDAENERVEREKQAKIDAENAKIEAEKAAKEAAENAIKQEQEKQRLAQEQEQERVRKLEADKNHVSNIRGEIKDDLVALGVDEDLSKKITLAIGKTIRNTKVIY